MLGVEHPSVLTDSVCKYGARTIKALALLLFKTNKIWSLSVEAGAEFMLALHTISESILD